MDKCRNSSAMMKRAGLDELVVVSPAAVDEAYQLAIKRGMTVTMPPTNEPWSVREFHLRHPDGHTFRVSAGFPEIDE